MNTRKLGMVSVALILMATNSLASAGESERDHVMSEADEALGIDCMPAKGFVKLLGKLSTLKADKTDSVSMVPEMKFVINDGGAMPSRVFFRRESFQLPFTLNDQGVVTDFIIIKDMHKDGEMCLQDKTRIGTPEDSDGLELHIDMELSFHNISGVHSLAELKDGLDDGRAHIKKIVPAMMRFMIPKFTHLGVSTEKGKPRLIRAYNNDGEVPGLNISVIENMQMIEYAQLKSLGADSLHITGGPYTLGPTPNPKDMKE